MPTQLRRAVPCFSDYSRLVILEQLLDGPRRVSDIVTESSRWPASRLGPAPDVADLGAYRDADGRGRWRRSNPRFV